MAQAQAADDRRLVLPARVAGRSTARRVWTVITLLVLVAGGAIAWWRWPRGAPEAVYRTSPVERRTIARVVEATGQVEVERRFEVPPPASGAVVELMVAAGATVEENQVLATLNPSSANAAAREAAAGLAASSSRVAAAQTDLDIAIERRSRVEGLFKDHFAKLMEVEAARAAEERARAALRAAKAERGVTEQRLTSAKEAQKVLTVRAPVAGIILRAPESVGATVSPDKGALFVIGSNLKLMQIDASVAEADIGVIGPGLKVEFTVPAFAGRVFRGTVERIAIEPERGANIVTYPVILRAENPDMSLRPGMSADVRIFVAEARDVVAVREAALRFSPDAEGSATRTRVWLSPNGVSAEPIEVTPGLSDGAFTQVEVKGPRPLKPGDAVVIGFLHPEQALESSPGIVLGKK